MARPAACLFDLDGLLLDTEPLHGLAWQAAARHFGAELSDEQLLSLRGQRRHDCAELVRALLPEPVSVEALLAVRQPIAEQLLGRSPAMPGAQALVERCHQEGIPMALATSSAAASVALKAAPHPWLSLIAERVTGDDPDLQAGKPAPDVFLLASERLGVAAAEAWAFEDSVAGARAASAAGCRVFVLPPHNLPLANYPNGVECLAGLHEVISRLS